MELTYSGAVEGLQKEFKDCGDFQLGELTVGENRLAAAFFTMAWQAGTEWS